MSALVLAALAALAGAGAVLVLAGATGRQVFAGTGPGVVQRWVGTTGVARMAAATGAAVAVALLTGWLAGAVLVAGAVFAAPRLLGGRASRQASIARTEAIASWTEMVRDSIAAASGLEEAILATAPVAPSAIAVEVGLLVRRLEHQSLPDALAAFGEEVAHPSADLVVAALTIAATMEASDLTGLLSRLADAIRGEARMRIRVEVGRTRVRTATKVIVGVVAVTIVFLAVVNREYLAAYDSSGGQLVLLVVGAIFAAGGWLLLRMAELDIPERFSARASTTEGQR
ncbi:MAG: pilus assembly protein TadB [Actinobacteria bacterium]|nr:pilus assembly protein TadB [Actinomycetota bacterium]